MLPKLFTASGCMLRLAQLLSAKLAPFATAHIILVSLYWWRVVHGVAPFAWHSLRVPHMNMQVIDSANAFKCRH